MFEWVYYLRDLVIVKKRERGKGEAKGDWKWSKINWKLNLK